MNIDNSKNQLNHQLKTVILKNFAYCKTISKMFYFSSQIFFEAGNSLYCPWLTKNLNSTRTPTEMKQNLLRTYSLFLNM